MEDINGLIAALNAKGDQRIFKDRSNEGTVDFVYLNVTENFAVMVDLIESFLPGYVVDGALTQGELKISANKTI